MDEPGSLEVAWTRFSCSDVEKSVSRAASASIPGVGQADSASFATVFKPMRAGSECISGGTVYEHAESLPCVIIALLEDVERIHVLFIIGNWFGEEDGFSEMSYSDRVYLVAVP